MNIEANENRTGKELINVSSGKRPLAPTRPRAWPVHDPPILDGKVPEGWTTEEPDLDEKYVCETST